MDVLTPCDKCGKRSATRTCSVCASKICVQCDREYGCDACKGGEKKFD